MAKYWYGYCPSCGQEGQLFVMKRSDNGTLFLECDECTAAWNTPEQVGAEKGYLAIDIDSHFADPAEIEKGGWSKYKLQKTGD